MTFSDVLITCTKVLPLTAAILTYCTGMTDTHILPKWLYTLGMVAVVGMIEGVFISSGDNGFQKEYRNRHPTPLSIRMFPNKPYYYSGIIQEESLKESLNTRMERNSINNC